MDTLQPTAKPEDPDTLQPSTPPAIAPASAAERAGKFGIAWPNAPDYQTLKSGIIYGQEPSYRMQMSIEKQAQDQQLKFHMLSAMASSKAMSGEPLTDEERDFVTQGPLDPRLYDPRTIMEVEYGRRFVDHTLGAKQEPENPYLRGMTREPNATTWEADVASENITRVQIAKTLLEDMDARASQDSYVKQGWDTLKTFIPGSSIWYASHLMNNSPVSNLQLPGSSLQDKIQYLYQLPSQAFGPTLKAAAEDMYARNPVEAQMFLNAVIKYSTMSKHLDNIFGAVDLFTAGQVGVGAAKALGKGLGIGVGKAVTAVQTTQDVRRVRAAMRATVEAQGETGPTDPVAVLTTVGDIPKAAELSVIDKLKAVNLIGDPHADAQQIIRSTPSIFNFGQYLKYPGSLAREAAQRLYDQVVENSQDLLDALGRSMKAQVARLPEQARGAAFASAERNIRGLYNRPNDMILDVIQHRSEQTLANVDTLEARFGRAPVPETPGVTLPQSTNLGAIQQLQREAMHKRSVELALGKPEGLLFDSPEQALLYDRDFLKLGVTPDDIKPQGSGYYISKIFPVREDADTVRDLLQSLDNKTPISLANMFFGGIRSAEDTTSVFQRNARHIATHAPQALQATILNKAKGIGVLAKGERKQLERILSVNRDMPNPDTPGMRGYFFKSQEEFETAWQELFKKLPSDAQTKAYWTYLQLSDFDYLLRNLSVYRDKMRQGREMFSFYNRTDPLRERVSTPYFEGRTVSDLPWTSREGFNIWSVDKSGVGKFLDYHLDPDEVKALAPKIQSGELKVTQVADPQNRPLADTIGNGNAVHFIISPEVMSRRLDWKQIIYNPGGHVIYPNPWYVKQPNILKGYKGLLNYYGDKTVFNFATEAQARRYSEAMDKARQMVLLGKDADLPDFLANNLPYNTAQFKALFREDGPLSLDHPIVHTKSGENSLKSVYQGKTVAEYYPQLRDHYNSSYNLNLGLDKEFLADKDAILPTIRQGESEGKPLFSLEPARQLDPFSSINRALGSAIRQRWINDYKTAAIESWIREFQGVFTTGKLENIRRNPTYFFFHPEFDTSIQDKAMLAAAKTARDNVINFIGARSELGGKVEYVRQKVMDMIYSAFGDKPQSALGGLTAADWAQTSLMPLMRDPARYLRNMAFHLKLGLFNPLQMFMQAQSLAHVMAIAGPGEGLRSTGIAFLLRRMAMGGWTEDEQLINHMGGLASKWGWWNKDNFAEMYHLMRSTGFGHVMGETAWRDDIFDPRLFRSTFGKILDAGTIPFAEGERAVRLAGFAQAYKDWRVAAGANATLDREAVGTIMTRADQYNINMSRASMAAWQRGILSIPFQFSTFTKNLFEQMLPGLIFGNRLTRGEAFSAFLTYGALYGIPVTLGAETLWPMYETIKKEALDRGINVNDTWYKNLFFEGILSTMLTAATGQHYNFAQRLGPSPIDILHQAMSGQKTIVDIVGGPAFGVMNDLVSSASPAFKAALSWFHDDGTTFPLRAEDFLDVVKNATTASNLLKAYLAVSTGRYFSRKDRYVSDVTPLDGVLMAASGLSPMELSDSYLKEAMMADDSRFKRQIEPYVIRNFNSAMQALRNNDPETAAMYLARSKTWQEAGQFQPHEINRIIKKAMTQDNISQVQQINRDFWLRAPQDKIRARMDAAGIHLPTE